MDLTMAFVGTRSMFEKAGFEVVGQTDAVASSAAAGDAPDARLRLSLRGSPMAAMLSGCSPGAARSRSLPPAPR